MAPWNDWQTHGARIYPGPQGSGKSAQWIDSLTGRPVTEEKMRAVLKSVSSIDLNIEAVYGEEKQGVDNFVVTAGAQ
jgi:hypothetical protein